MKKPYSLLSALAGFGLLMALVGPYAALAQDHEGHEEAELTEETRQLIHEVRGTTAVYRDLDLGLDAGYGKFLECFTWGDVEGMGQHYVNGALLDDVLDPAQPEALVYELTGDGEPILVAFEYIVPAEAWDPDDEGREPPTLFDQVFHLKTNIPDTPPVWVLHIWLWTHNPNGLFADYNPLVFCPEGEPVVDMSAR